MQYDIDLVHKIEELVGKQLEKYECDEGEVRATICRLLPPLSAGLGPWLF